MVNRDKRYIDPMFYIPEGIPPEEWDYIQDGLVDYSDEVGVGEQDGDVEGSGDGPDDLMTIDNLIVISQTLRRIAGGEQRVDIVVEVDDVPGATKYEFRVTKE